MKSANPMAPRHQSPVRQRGAATLIIALIALVLITIMTIYTAKVGVMDQRMSGNEYRYREAAAAAEAGVNQAVAFFKARQGVGINTPTASWTWTDGGCRTNVTTALGSAPCTEIVSNLSLANGAQVPWARVVRCTQALVTPICPAATGNYNYYVFRAQGVSADGTATVAVQQQMAFAANTSSSAPNSPVVAAGNVALNGNFNVVANPNGGGPGVPVSVWSNSAVAGGGSSATCNQAGFSGQACTSDKISVGTTVGADVVANDPLTTASPPGNFPADVFAYLFGVSSSNYQTVKDRATQITDCGTLGGTSVGLYWYTGSECHVSATTVGAASDDTGTPDVEGPVILVVQDADFRMSAGTTFNGIIFIFSTTGTASTYNVRTNGNALVNGVLMTNAQLDDQINGTFTARYDADILAQLTSSPTNNGPVNGTPADVPGSWRDF